MHWSFPYLRQKWTEEHDCFYWFAHVQRRQFARPVPYAAGESAKKHVIELLQWKRQHWIETTDPQDGDAVIMTQPARPADPYHIGVWCDGQVLHAQQGCRIALETIPQLQIKGWTIRSLLTYA